MGILVNAYLWYMLDGSTVISRDLSEEPHLFLFLLDLFLLHNILKPLSLVLYSIALLLQLANVLFVNCRDGLLFIRDKSPRYRVLVDNIWRCFDL